MHSCVTVSGLPLLISDGCAFGETQFKTFFSPRFGRVTDRFDVQWMVIVPA